MNYSYTLPPLIFAETSDSRYISPFSFLLSFFTCLTFLVAQEADTRPTVAVLDFEARDITQVEAQTLTERLRTEIGNTNAVRLIERKAIDKILEEQGLQQTGCVTDECAVEVGKLLGIQFMINGAIGKVGETYTIDAKMFSVETGVTERTKSITYIGKIEGLITEMEILAWEIVGLKAPQRLLLKRELAVGVEKKDVRPTVAVLDFEARGISMLEAQTLTDRFRTEIGKTGVTRLVERTTMNEVLKEQEFQATGCISDECAVEVGQLLGVKFIVSGAIGKVGNTYTIDAKMFAVRTGVAERMRNVTYQGEVDGLITEIEILAWEMVGLQVPKGLKKKRRLGTKVFLKQQASAAQKTRNGALIRSLVFPGLGHLYTGKQKWGYGWVAAEVGLFGLILASYSSYQSAQDDYNRYMALYRKETNTTKIAGYKAKVRSSRNSMESSSTQVKVITALAGGVWLANAVHAYLLWPKEKTDRSTTNNGAIRLVYDPNKRQTQLRWEITLD